MALQPTSVPCVRAANSIEWPRHVDPGGGRPLRRFAPRLVRLPKIAMQALLCSAASVQAARSVLRRRIRFRQSRLTRSAFKPYAPESCQLTRGCSPASLPGLGGASVLGGMVGARSNRRVCARRAHESGTLRAFTYFLVSRDFCDHVFLYEDGTFTFGCSDAPGTWSVIATAEGSNGAHELELRWQAGSNLRGPGHERLVSTDGGSGKFDAAGASLAHVEGEHLPLLQQAPEERRPRALVFSSIGDQCLPVVRDHWLRSAPDMDFDLALVFYAEPSSDVFSQVKELSDQFPSVQLVHNEGMKWPNFKFWLNTQGGAATVASKYDYIWVVDDDVRLPSADISKMFRILREHDQIKFACPSFDAGSDGVWRFFDGHDPRFKLRYTNFVECTAPVLKTTMLLDPLFEPCLRAVRTGCFIDFCFYHAAGARQDAVAVIDAVQCHHPPRTLDAPSEMRRVQAWHDHKNDDVYFEQEGVPKEWWGIEPRFFQPRVFGGVPA